MAFWVPVRLQPILCMQLLIALRHKHAALIRCPARLIPAPQLTLSRPNILKCHAQG